MSYALDHSASTPERLVLRRARRVDLVMHSISIGVGLPAIIAGLVGRGLVSGTDSMPVMALGAGIFLTSASQMVRAQFRAPRKLLFDNAQGTLLIDESGRNGASMAAIPYDEIEGFRWCPYGSLSGGGYGSSSAVVEMTLRNGAIWTLSRLPAKGQAEGLAAEIERRVDLKRHGERPSLARVFEHLRVEQRGGETVIRWRRRYSTFQSLLLLGSAFGLLTAVFGARPMISAPMYYGLFGCVSLLALLALYALLAAAFRPRGIVISPLVLCTEQRLSRFGKVALPLDEIGAVVYHFAPSHRDALFVLRPLERERLVALTRGAVSIENALAAKALSSKLARIEVGDLTMPEKLALKEILRRALHERTGRIIY